MIPLPPTSLTCCQPTELILGFLLNKFSNLTSQSIPRLSKDPIGSVPLTCRSVFAGQGSRKGQVTFSTNILI